MATQGGNDSIQGNDARRRVARTPIVTGWNGGSAVTAALSDNVGLAQHQIWWNSTGATGGAMTIWVRPAKSGFWVPIANVSIVSSPTGNYMLPGIFDGVQITMSGLAGTLSLNAGINSVGIDFTPNGNRSLVDRRRFQVMEVATGWNGAATITGLAPDHQGYSQHQIAITGGVGTVKIQARPLGSGVFCDIDSDTQALSAGGALAIFPGMYDAFQIVPVGTVTGSINAQVISIAQEMFLPVTAWQMTRNFASAFNLTFGFPQPADDSKVVHLAGTETITGIKYFGSNTAGATPVINGPAGSNRGIAFDTASVARWQLYEGSVLESGSNVGSDLYIAAFNDAGTLLYNVIDFNRASGVVTTHLGLIALNGQSAASNSSSINVETSAFFGYGLYPQMSAASLNPIVSANDGAIIFSRQTVGTYGFVLAPWNSSSCGMRMDANGGVTLQNVGGASSLVIRDSGANGCNISLVGPGSTTPSKTIRTVSGQLQFVNNAYNAVVSIMDDLGDWTFSGLSTHAIVPSADNAYALGGSANRWSVVYAATGTINTSDVREKNITGKNNLGLDFVNSLTINLYKWIVGHNVVSTQYDPETLEGTDTLTPVAGIRTHVGPTAQDVASALTNAGVSPSDFALWGLFDKNDPTSRQQLRPDEAMWILWTAVQQLSSAVTQNTSDIAAIKAKLGMP